MSHDLIKDRYKDFVGKTVARVDAEAVNIATFFFTDGTAVAIETEHITHGIHGMIVCDECVSEDKCESSGKT
jgi:hypothetical protein